MAIGGFWFPRRCGSGDVVRRRAGALLSVLVDLGDRSLAVEEVENVKPDEPVDGPSKVVLEHEIQPGHIVGGAQGAARGRFAEGVERGRAVRLRIEISRMHSERVDRPAGAPAGVGADLESEVPRVGAEELEVVAPILGQLAGGVLHQRRVIEPHDGQPRVVLPVVGQHRALVVAVEVGPGVRTLEHPVI